MRWITRGVLGQFPEPFLEHLRAFRFSGDVWAVPEGTIVFPNEPIVQVIAPILEVQAIETLVVNLVHFPSLATLKAARVVLKSPSMRLARFRQGTSIAIVMSLVASRRRQVGRAGSGRSWAGWRACCSWPR